MATRPIRVEGLEELQRAFRVYDRGLARGIGEVLEAAAEPVRQDAQGLARVTIKQGRVPWHEMRTGLNRRSSYIAPVQRGAKSRLARDRYGRENFKDLMLSRAMEPALDRNAHRVEDEFEEAMRDLARLWSRV